ATFADGESFLSVNGEQAGCVLLDISMPGQSGLDILKELRRRHYRAPILMVSGHNETPLVVDAIKNGAFDFVEKPFDGNELVQAVARAIESCTPQDAAVITTSLIDPAASAVLTRREMAVLEHLVSGASNKETGRRLGISHRTVEIHRANIMLKLRADSFADLIRIALA
ncbi:MAG TPA: response regulator, partial [Pseudolabrys sp.]|nr:response regulator [Pseudolabrys sp.]